MKDILLSVVFMLNMGFMVLFAIDFLKKYKTNESSGKNNEADENSKDVTEHEPTSAPVRKAGVGKSKFSMDDVRRIAAKASENAVSEFMEEMDIEDVEFDETESPENTTQLSPEEIKTAFETDQRIADEISDSDDSIATPNATGADFDELARAELILGRKTEPTTEEHQYVVRVFANFKNTELMDHIPRYILDKLDECQRKVEALGVKIETTVPEKVSVNSFDEFIISDFIPKSQTLTPTTR